MPKTLYLVRHAKSSWKDESLSDRERPLNKRGKRDAPFIGKYLRQKGEVAEVLISSPAKRTLSTAKLIAGELGLNKNDIVIANELYMAGISEFIKTIQHLIDLHKSVMIFGHNPGITEFANFVSNAGIDNIPTAGTVRIDFNINAWKEIENKKGKMNFFIFPKMFG